MPVFRSISTVLVAIALASSISATGECGAICGLRPALSLDAADSDVQAKVWNDNRYTMTATCPISPICPSRPS
jgi:hypothetical protein